jgi:hypothetical protein
MGPVTRPLIILSLTRRDWGIGDLREEIVRVGRSVNGVANHDAVAEAIPRFSSEGFAFEKLVKEAMALEIEGSKVIPLLLELLDYVRYVNPKDLRDYRELEFWEEGLLSALKKLALLAGGLDVENHPSFHRLLEWKDATERDLDDDSYEKVRSNSEEVDLPDTRANEAPRQLEILSKRYEEQVAVHKLAAYLDWMTLERSGRSLEIYQSFREDLRHARFVGTYPFPTLSEGEITDLRSRRLAADLFRGEGDGV